MEGFKKIAKMQCFKEGGSVQRQIANYEKRERKTEEKADEKEDKKIVKKAFSIHDKQLHETEKTDLSKLKQGGRAKKEKGTVKKYKAGGDVTNVYGTKKTAVDKKNISKTKQIKAPKAKAPSAPLTAPMEDAAMVFQKKGGKVKKMANGGMPGSMSEVDAKLAALEKQRQMEKMKRARSLSPSEQGQLISQSPAAAGLGPAAAAAGSNAAAGLGSMIKKTPAEMPEVDPMGSATGNIPMKKGGKVKGKC